MIKNIWLLWLQGWDNAPELQKIVKKSWEIWNPEWNIICLDEINVNKYIDISIYKNIPTPQAMSDAIRLELLSNIGGVWADSTMLCLAPLDSYMLKAIEPSGFWMYRGSKGACPASWFMASEKNSVISTKWCLSCRDFWKQYIIGHNLEYFWMDKLFDNLYYNDTEFSHNWNITPHLSCEDYGQAHCLVNRMFGEDHKLQKTIIENPPYAMKLWKNWISSSPEKNVSVAINRALDSNAKIPVHQMK